MEKKNAKGKPPKKCDARPGALDEKGCEVPDPRPLATVLGLRKPETLDQKIKRLIVGQVSAAAEAEGYESFTDANDFDIPEDPIDPKSPYEVEFDPEWSRKLGRPVTAEEVRRAQARAVERVAREKRGRGAESEGRTPSGEKRPEAPPKPEVKNDDSPESSKPE